MNCYLCKNKSNTIIKNRVRDREDIKVLKCDKCGLVFLDKNDHIDNIFYEQGGMGKSVNFKNIVDSTDSTDTNKRFNLHNKIFANKRILDFGCGKGSLLKKIKQSQIAKALFAFEPNIQYQENLC